VAESLLKPFELARYFGRAKDLPGVRELFEQEGMTAITLGDDLMNPKIDI
jgi:hypothetical protein